VEPSLNYIAAASLSSTTTPSLSVSASAGTWGAARMSASGTCYTIKETAAGATKFGSTGTAGNCSGTWAVTGTNTNSAAFP
jgi:hypothetical protein